MPLNSKQKRSGPWHSESVEATGKILVHASVTLSQPNKERLKNVSDKLNQ